MRVAPLASHWPRPAAGHVERAPAKWGHVRDSLCGCWVGNGKWALAIKIEYGGEESEVRLQAWNYSDHLVYSGRAKDPSAPRYGVVLRDYNDRILMYSAFYIYTYTAGTPTTLQDTPNTIKRR